MNKRFIPLTQAEETEMRVAAYGAVVLLSIAHPGGLGTGKVNMVGGLVLASATGIVGEVLAGKGKVPIKGRNAAQIADEVLPALSNTVATLEAKAPAEVGEFRRAVTAALNDAMGAVKTGQAHADMLAKIQAAMDPA